MKILNKPDNAVIHLFLIVLVYMSACSSFPGNKKDFIDKFKSDLKERKINSISEYTKFPLKNGEYLADQEIDQTNFIDNFNSMFDSVAIETIINSDLQQFKEIESQMFEEQEDVFQINVNYKTEDTETTVIYFFGKQDSKFYFLGIDMAG